MNNGVQARTLESTDSVIIETIWPDPFILQRGSPRPVRSRYCLPGRLGPGSSRGFSKAVRAELQEEFR